MKRVVEIIRTCGACPEQYEGKLDSGEEFYVRCRWGYGYLEVNKNTVSEIGYENDPLLGMFEEGDLEKLFFDAGIYLDRGLIKDSE